MSMEYLDKNGLEQVWDKIKKKNVCVPDVNLILEYSTNASSGANREYGLGGMCYIGNNQYVFYVRNADSNGNRGNLVCIDGSTKKFLWRTNSIPCYHGNTCVYANNGIYLSAAENDNGTYVQKYMYFPLNGPVTDGVKSGDVVETDMQTLGLGGNIAYDRSTGTFYSSVGRHIQGGQNYGDIYKWSGTFSSKVDTINLVTANSSNAEVVDLIVNGWYQGCCVENGIFYQLYWRDHSIIAAYDLSTGVHIKSWNIPDKSNYCKVMNEIQDITYNYDNGNFLVVSSTYTARIAQTPIVNISEVGLYKNLHVTVPSRLQALVATSAAYDNCFVANIEMGANGFRTSGDEQGHELLTDSVLRDDCTPCCDRYDATGEVQQNRFRSIKDAEYAYECCTPGGGRIKFVFTNTFDTSFTVSSPAFLKPCIITAASGKVMTLSGPFLAGCPNAYICGESASNPIVITGGGGAGYPEKNTTNGRGSASPLSLILVGNGNELALKNVKFKKNTTPAPGYPSILYGVYVYENGHLTVGENVTIDTSAYTEEGCRVAFYDVMPNKLFIATSTTVAGTAAKEADINDTTDSASFSLRTGIRVAVRFTAGNSATTPTLNVNGTGAKSIAYPTSASAVATGNGGTYNRWGPNETVTFTYNGTYWVSGPSKLTNYVAYNTAISANNAASAALKLGTDINLSGMSASDVIDLAYDLPNGVHEVTNGSVGFPESTGVLHCCNTESEYVTWQFVGASGQVYERVLSMSSGDWVGNWLALGASLIIKTYTYAYSSIANGGSLNVTATNLNMSTPSGYTPIAAQQVSSGNGNVVARTWNVAATGSTVAVALRNVATTAQSGTVTFVVVYAKTSMITT